MAYGLGSIATEVGRRIDNIPSSISGTEMNGIIIDEINFAEKKLGVAIGSTAIEEKYFGVIARLTMSTVQGVIETQGSDKQSVSLGELSVGKSNMTKEGLSGKWRQEAIDMIKELKGSYNYYQTFS